MKTLLFPVLCFFLISLDVVSSQICFDGFFRPNSTYDSNRRLILSSLSSNVATHDGFYNYSIGQNPNSIFIIAMCIPGTKPETCSDCIKVASESLLHSCPNQTEAYIWSDSCMVRYSNVSFSGVSLDTILTEPSQVMYNIGDINPNLTVFDRIGEDLMERTITPASRGNNKYYATGVASLTSFLNAYAMMQCTPNVSPGQCGVCLRANLDDYKSCCRRKQGGTVIRPSCFIRWDSHPFAADFVEPPPISPPLSKDGKTISVVAIVVPIVVVVVLVLLVVVFVVCRRRKFYITLAEVQVGDGITTTHSVQFDFKTIEDATDKFMESNMIGRGGFGEVYKGKLSSGAEVAVKRLSKTSGQGAQEFKNEALLVTKLQHRNLVRLLGFCLEGEEKILVYEFVPNKSLDYFLFDPAKQGKLDWKRRYNIIGGIARGILYLHHDSRLTIIHCDLKASNILLDADMNPKIADFGMARTFIVDQTHANTRRIVGTYGYMSPEYAMRGHVSMKSDVYSFGVMILEIISGKQNSSFNHIDDSVDNLVTHAWRLWSHGSPLELVDPTIEGRYESNAAIRCIHVALLCVQKNPADRPLLPAIIMMLTSSTITLPVPQAPGFCFATLDPDGLEFISDSNNDVTITVLDPR